MTAGVGSPESGVGGERGANTVALASLEAWFETMRAREGYAGPVAHWWRDCLWFAGAGHDWRYEGIISGYLELWQRTGSRVWLDKAQRAGDDLLAAQTASGHYLNSRFEQNPGIGGTPHEAAADVGLLLLAGALRDAEDGGWQRYREAARRNLEQYFIGSLWDTQASWFRDDPSEPSFVPNKAATLIEALCLLARLGGPDKLADVYVRGAAEGILRHQVRRAGHSLDGAIAQNTWQGAVVEKYFPYYAARCVPGLLEAANLLEAERYAEAAERAMSFVFRTQDGDGAFPQAVYGNGRVNRYPRWIAAVGDILRAADLLRGRGAGYPQSATLEWLRRGQLTNGAFRCADGFAGQVTQKVASGLADFRDVLPVCGWNDKAFRYLASRATEDLEGPASSPVLEMGVSYFGAQATFRIDGHGFSVEAGSDCLYSWEKANDWATVRGQG